MGRSNLRLGLGLVLELLVEKVGVRFSAVSIMLRSVDRSLQNCMHHVTAETGPHSIL